MKQMIKEICWTIAIAIGIFLLLCMLRPPQVQADDTTDEDGCYLTCMDAYKRHPAVPYRVVRMKCCGEIRDTHDKLIGRIQTDGKDKVIVQDIHGKNLKRINLNTGDITDVHGKRLEKVK